MKNKDRFSGIVIDCDNYKPMNKTIENHDKRCDNCYNYSPMVPALRPTPLSCLNYEYDGKARI